MKTFNDGIHDTSLNITIEFFKQIYNAFYYIEIRAAESKTDTNYQRILMRTSIDCQRLIKGVRGNALISHFVDPIIKSMDYDFKFPMKPVRIDFFD